MRHVILIAVLLVAGPLAAQPRPPAAPADIAGAADHPMVGRYDGSVQRLREQVAFGEMRVVTAPMLPGPRPAGTSRVNDTNSTAVAGRLTRLRSEGPDGRSPIEIVRNWQQRLEQGGFRSVFACEARGCGGGGNDLWQAVTDARPGRAGIAANWGSQSYAVMRLERPAGDVWVALLSVIGPRNQPQTLVDVAEVRPMETDRIVFVDAAQMERSIASTGRVALYGINFDTDRAEPRPDSRPTIEEIAKYLRANAGVSVVVAGHTDSQGAFDHNVDLSRRRAAAVIAMLTRDFGIPAARLTAFGAGMAAPVAANDSDQGRAQNRRVEIVRR